MMINKRLIGTVRESKRYIAGNVIFQWISLIANMIMIFSLSQLLENLFQHNVRLQNIAMVVVVVLAAISTRFFCTVMAARMSYLSAKTVKESLRVKIYRKLLRLGTSYRDQVLTSEVVQVAVEGVDQLETYFGSYLPQFFYSMLAPVTLFIVLSFVNLPAATVLLVCVPLIPIAIAAVQTIAKKLLSDYWSQYTTLGDTFLENLQGLTTLKIYQADGYKNEEMNREAEKFRKITMKVLTMQLNSVTIMDLIAFGGAALGMILAVTQFRSHHISLTGCLSIILLSADFFIPMRQLGSYFHIAMNGMAASDKIFRLLDMPETAQGNEEITSDCCEIICRDLCFSYDEERQILDHVNLAIPQGIFIALVGESGCGKSTIASLLMGRSRKYSGSVTFDGREISSISEKSLMKTVTYVSHNSYLFKGTVRENLLMGNPQASEEELWQVLEQTKLADFLREEQGLDTVLTEKGGNFSGGQCQRLALARALLHNSPIYIFDEATSNIDVESENDIMEQIQILAHKKTVVLISHRLANVSGADQIYVMKNGKIEESGSHQELLKIKGTYAKLWQAQENLEQYGRTRFDSQKQTKREVAVS